MVPHTDDVIRTRDRIDGRKHAEELLELSEITDRSSDFAFGFWREIARQAAANLPPESAPVGPRVMSDHEARMFESVQISFGKHAGKTFGDVDADYLAWLADSARDIQAYVRSDRGRRRIDAETD